MGLIHCSIHQTSPAITAITIIRIKNPISNECIFIAAMRVGTIIFMMPDSNYLRNLDLSLPANDLIA